MFSLKTTRARRQALLQSLITLALEVLKIVVSRKTNLKP